MPRTKPRTSVRGCTTLIELAMVKQQVLELSVDLEKAKATTRMAEEATEGL